MTSRKRVSVLILMLALIVPILAACGGGSTASPTAATGGSSAPTAATGGSETTAMPAATAMMEATAMPAATAMMEATAMTEATTMPAATAMTAATASAGGAMSNATAGASGDVTKIAVEDGATLRLAVSGSASEQKLYQDGVDRFKKVFPNVTVTMEPIADQYETTLKAGFSANSAQDVFILNSELMGAFAPNGLLLPLDDAMNSAGAKIADYYPSLTGLFQQDGKTYGLPKDLGALVVFVNNDMAQQAGVDPASIKTWDNLKDAAKKMTTGEGPGKTYGMCLNPDIQRYGASILQNGNPVIENNKATFNQENAVQAIQFWYSFKQDGTGELFKELGKGWCGEAFSGKNTAMVVEGGWLIPFLADPANNATDLKYTAIQMPIPTGGKPSTWLFTNAFAANAKTKYPNAAAALVLYLTGAQNEQALIPSGLALPSLQSLSSDPYFQQNAAQQVLVQAGSYGQLADVVLGGPVKKGDVISTLNTDALEPIFLGAASVQDALNTAAQKVDAILQR